MGLSHSPYIVTDGLVLCLDAANPRSYPGAGTTWTDLGKESNNLSLANNPTFSSVNGGIFTFDGTDDYASIADSSEKFTFANGNFSMGAWVACPNPISGDHFIITKGANLAGGGFYLVYAKGGKDAISFARYYSGALFQNVRYNYSISDWIYVLGTCDPSGGAGSMKLYLNGALVSTQSFAQVQTAASNTFSLEISKFNVNNNVQYYTPQDIGLVHIYNRVLSANEVQQNYNATRWRFQ